MFRVLLYLFISSFLLTCKLLNILSQDLYCTISNTSTSSPPLITPDKFMHEARVMICEMYCTINRRVDLNMLADKLQMSEEESEKWIVEMVRNAGPGSNTLDAKIDSSAKQVGTSVVCCSAE